jgi:circadian clock protein KaiB
MNNDDIELNLYIAGISPISKKAIERVNDFCLNYLKKKIKYNIIDIYKEPEKAKQEQIVAVPVLVQKFNGKKKKFLINDVDKIYNEIITNQNGDVAVQ